MRSYKWMLIVAALAVASFVQSVIAYADDGSSMRKDTPPAIVVEH